VGEIPLTISINLSGSFSNLSFNKEFNIFSSILFIYLISAIFTLFKKDFISFSKSTSPE
jgi:hypothetical protein